MAELPTGDSPLDVAANRLIPTFPPGDKSAGGVPLMQTRDDIRSPEATQGQMDAGTDDEAKVTPRRGATTYAKRTDLEGHEGDLFSSWQSSTAFLSATDRRGQWGISNDSDGTPTPGNSIGEGGIADGDRTLFFGRLRADSDPDQWAMGPALDADEYPAGTVLHISPWAPYDPDNHVRATLTAGATLTGAGNAAYLAAPVSLVEVGDIADQSAYYRISEIVPSGLDMDIPPSAVAGTAMTVGAGNAVAAALTALVELLEAASAAVLTRWRRIIQGNNEAVTIRLRRVQGHPAAAGDIQLPTIGGDIVVGSVQVKWPATDKAGDALPMADMLAYVAGDFFRLKSAELQIGDSGIHHFGGGTYQFPLKEAPGYTIAQADFPAVGDTVDATFEGRDIHLGLVVAQILKRAAANVGGKGGAAGKVWGWVSGAADAGWRRLLDVLKLDAATPAAKAEYRAALATGLLTKDIAGGDDLILTADEAAYAGIRLTGARTATCIVTFPASAVGVHYIQEDATVYSVKAKVAGQSDAAAVTLSNGKNLLLHDGGRVQKAAI